MSEAAPREDVLGRAYDGRLVRRLARYARPHARLVLLSLALLLGTTAVSLAQPWLVKLAIDGYILRGDPKGLLLPASLFLASLAAEFALGYFQLYTLERAGQNVVFDVRNDVFSHLQRLSASFFDRTPVGRLMTRVTTDVEALNEAFTSGLVLLLADLVKLAAIVGILLWMDWRMALVTFAILPPMLVVSWFFRVRVRDAYRRVRTAVARLNAYLQESVSGMRIVQLFRRERSFQEEFGRLNDGHRDAQLSGVFYESAFSAAVELMATISLASIVWAGGWRLIGGAVTFGTLVAFLEYAGRFFRPVQELSQRYTVMQAAMASSERIFHLLDTPPAVVSPENAARVEGKLRGEIAFEHVTFGYDPGTPVLRDVTFRVPPFDTDEAARTVRELAGYRMLEGARGAPPVDVDAFVDTIMKVQRLALDLADVVGELDINPLRVRRRGAVALDALVVKK